MKIAQLSNHSVAGKRLLIRQDLNVPLAQGTVTSEARIRAALPTIQQAQQAGARTMLMSHLGRPDEGRADPAASLAPVARCLSAALGRPVRLIADYLQHPPELAAGDVVLLENVRFNRGERGNDAALARCYGKLCDLYVMDAFAVAHRAQASTHAVMQYAPASCAGPLLIAELDALANVLHRPARPLVAVVGGAKVSTKLVLLEALDAFADQLLLGGGLANTFIAAAGHAVGRSLYEPDLRATAARLMQRSRDQGKPIPLPQQVVVGTAFDRQTAAVVKPSDAVQPDELILDLGPATIRQYARIVSQAGTIIWNGPLGACELPQFSTGTREIGRAIAQSPAFSMAGGGDTLAVLEQFDLSSAMSRISTGGGAFLTALQGTPLPAVAILEQQARA